MIKIVKGDLLYAKEDVIAHQVNCQGKMGSGVALQIKETYPKAYKEYKELVDKHMVGEDLRHTLLGSIQGVNFGIKQHVVNMFGQNTYGSDGKQYTDTEALFKCFKKLRDVAENRGMSVALPYLIGCHRGGADWKEVENLLLIAFDGYSVTLYKKEN